jgi:putative spermidine/putrescine transport system permease protein
MSGVPSTRVTNAGRGARRGRRPWALIGVVPFLAYVIIFLVVPAGAVMVEAFRANDGSISLTNLATVLSSKQPWLHSYAISLELSAISAVIAAVLGLVGTVALVSSPSRLVRRLVTTGCGVLANTGGVPLAFAFIATIGNAGVVTHLLADMGFDPYDHGFSLYSFAGLVIVYLYFLLPLVILLMLPPVEALRHEWREAAATLGASSRSYWQKVGFPVLTPPFIATLMVLFMDAFAAYATAQALTTGSVPLVPIEIGSLLAGNVVTNQANLGDALGLGMIVIVGAAGALYVFVQRKTARWLR